MSLIHKKGFNNNYTAVASSGTVGVLKPVNHTNCMSSVIATDHPQSVRNSCVIKQFIMSLMLGCFKSLCFVFSGLSVIPMSHTSFLLSLSMNKTNHPISSSSYPTATATKTIHCCLKWRGNKTIEVVWSCALNGRFWKLFLIGDASKVRLG